MVRSSDGSNIFTDLNVENDVEYDYQVTAIDRQNPPNESAATSSVSATPTSSAAPTTPTELARSGDYLAPTFAFANASPFNSGATLTYTIQVSSESDFSNVTASVSGLAEGAGDAGTGQTAWTIDRDLVDGATYYWRVRAVEEDLIGEFSESEEFAAIDPTALAGDFNGDGTVTLDDFFLFVDVFDQPAEGDAAKFDLDGNNQVGLSDFFIFVDNFGKTVAGKRFAAFIVVSSIETPCTLMPSRRTWAVFQSVVCLCSGTTKCTHGSSSEKRRSVSEFSLSTSGRLATSPCKPRH